MYVYYDGSELCYCYQVVNFGFVASRRIQS